MLTDSFNFDRQLLTYPLVKFNYESNDNGVGSLHWKTLS